MKYSYVLGDTCGACSAIKNYLDEDSFSHFLKMKRHLVDTRQAYKISGWL